MRAAAAAAACWLSGTRFRCPWWSWCPPTFPGVTVCCRGDATPRASRLRPGAPVLVRLQRAQVPAASFSSATLMLKEGPFVILLPKFLFFPPFLLSLSLPLMLWVHMVCARACVRACVRARVCQRRKGKPRSGYHAGHSHTLISRQ